MLSLQIADVKKFMQLLLMTDTFDDFLMMEAVLVKEFRMEIDGSLTQGFYSEEEKESLGLAGRRHLPYAHFRPVILEQVKGKRLPELLKITFAMQGSDAVKVLKTLEECPNHAIVNDFVLQVIYDHNGLFVRTGVSYSTFVPDRSMEALWEEFVPTFLKRREIAFE